MFGFKMHSFYDVLMMKDTGSSMCCNTTEVLFRYNMCCNLAVLSLMDFCFVLIVSLLVVKFITNLTRVTYFVNMLRKFVCSFHDNLYVIILFMLD